MIRLSSLFVPRRAGLARYRCLAALVVAMAVTHVSAAESTPLFPAPVYVTLQGSSAVENMPGQHSWIGVPSAHYDAIGPHGDLMLVSSKDQPKAFLLDAHDGRRLASFDIGPAPQGVTISPDGRWGLAVSAGNGTITLIDMHARMQVATIPVGQTPHNARFSADGKLAYVTLQGGTGVAVVDMRTRKKVREIPVPGIRGPHNLDLSADGKTMWVRDLVGHVAAVDLASGRELAVIPVGLGHAGIDVIPGGRYVFTGAIADHVVDVIDPATFKVVKRIDVGQGPHGVRASRDGRWVYAAVTGTDKLAVIDVRTLKVVKQVPVQGELPFWLAIAGND